MNKFDKLEISDGTEGDESRVHIALQSIRVTVVEAKRMFATQDDEENDDVSAQARQKASKALLAHMPQALAENLAVEARMPEEASDRPNRSGYWKRLDIWNALTGRG